MGFSSKNIFLILLVVLLCASQAHAFGAGNIASISAVEGRNWRHGDIEDVLKTIACIKHQKWTSIMMKRIYFGNWLRDYSQAMDTGALKKAQPETIRVLVWLLSFLSFGYATAEFEVTKERLGVYRPEEHIDNPKDYNDNEDARKFDPRLRAPVRDVELAIDPDTGMKNYIAKQHADWATSSAFVKWSFEQSIHHGRQYCSGRGIFRGNDDELAEACRLLGQGLHTLEDFGAHTNYVELVLRDMGMNNVFPHVGERTMINVRGKHIFPLVTGTFGMVDFYHSVLGEATDHFTQSEISEMDNAMGVAQTAASSNNPLMTLIKLLSKVPGTKDLCDEAQRLQANSRAMEGNQSWGGASRGIDDNYSSSRAGPGDWNQSYQQPGGYDQGYEQTSQRGWNDPAYEQFLQNQQHQQGWQQPPSQQNWQQPPPAQQQWNPQQSFQQPQELPGSTNWNQAPPPDTNIRPTPSRPQEKPAQGDPAGKMDANIDPAKLVSQIYPILAFRDKVVRAISAVIEKIPGLEALVERIVETLTVFILSLLAPIVRPLINTLTKTLEAGSEGVVSSNGKHQFDVWNDPNSTDPTHSMLSKDHFSNILNEPAGAVAAEILKFIAPRILYAWEHPDVPTDQVMRDVEVIFHHPALRDEKIEVHRNMYKAVQDWARHRSDGGRSLDQLLSSASVKAGKNHKAGVSDHAMVNHHTMSSQQMHAAASGQHTSGGFLDSVSGLVGNISPGHAGSSSYFGGSSGQHHQQSSSPFGMVGDLVGKFSGGGGQHQQHHGSSGGGGGLNDMLHMAEKLPIPGMHGMTSKLNKFGLGGGGGHSGGGLGNLFGGGGRRGLDDEGGSRGLDEDYAGAQQPQQQQEQPAAYSSDGYAGPGDYGTAPQPPRSPSPLPMVPPPGYESYTASGLEYDGRAAAPGAYGGNVAGGYESAGTQEQSYTSSGTQSGYYDQQSTGGGYQQQGGGYSESGGNYYR